MGMRNTLEQAKVDADSAGCRYICQFKGGYKAMHKPSNIGKVVWDGRGQAAEASKIGAEKIAATTASLHRDMAPMLGARVDRDCRHTDIRRRERG